jgi:hypothetical protein
MKVCPNSKCQMFGRIVYALATRCPLCKWDLSYGSVAAARADAPKAAATGK